MKVPQYQSYVKCKTTSPLQTGSNSTYETTALHCLGGAALSQEITTFIGHNLKQIKVNG